VYEQNQFENGFMSGCGIAFGVIIGLCALPLITGCICFGLPVVMGVFAEVMLALGF
jgi:CO dehydrogenase/acetyl-CoA synthase alpha subunit